MMIYKRIFALLPVVVLFMLWTTTNSAVSPLPCKNYYSNALKQNIYTEVDSAPEFPGGSAACQRFLNKNLRFPALDSDALQTMPSTVKIKFIVDAEGRIKQAVALHGNSEGEPTPLEKEVLRVYSLMPTWKPGKCRDKTVAVELTRPMVICLEKAE